MFKKYKAWRIKRLERKVIYLEIKIKVDEITLGYSYTKDTMAQIRAKTKILQLQGYL